MVDGLYRDGDETGVAASFNRSKFDEYPTRISFLSADGQQYLHAPGSEMPVEMNSKNDTAAFRLRSTFYMAPEQLGIGTVAFISMDHDDQYIAHRPAGTSFKLQLATVCTLFSWYSGSHNCEMAGGPLSSIVTYPSAENAIAETGTPHCNVEDLAGSVCGSNMRCHHAQEDTGYCEYDYVCERDETRPPTASNPTEAPTSAPISAPTEASSFICPSNPRRNEGANRTIHNPHHGLHDGAGTGNEHPTSIWTNGEYVISCTDSSDCRYPDLHGRKYMCTSKGSGGWGIGHSAGDAGVFDVSCGGTDPLTATASHMFGKRLIGGVCYTAWFDCAECWDIPPPADSYPQQLDFWSFTSDYSDLRHTRLEDTPRRRQSSASAVSGGVLNLGTSCDLSVPLRLETNADVTDRTIEAWIKLNDIYGQVGDGFMGLQVDPTDRDEFDSITYAEIETGHWIAGSSFHRRTLALGDTDEATLRGAPAPPAPAYIYIDTPTASWSAAREFCLSRGRDLAVGVSM